MHVKSALQLKPVGGISLCDGGELEEYEGYCYFFVVFLCVKIEIDQLLCVICSVE